MSRHRATVCHILLRCVFAMLGPLGAPSLSASAQNYAFGRADFATGASPVWLVTGDFNGDGKPDLATANSGDNTVSVLIGKPDGTFQPHVDYKVGTSPSAIATGDFNGDGKLDLAVTNSGDGTVSVLLGNGDGTLKVSGPYGVGKAPVSVATGDFNEDGKLDLAVADSGSNSVSVLIGRGDGTLASPVDYAVGGGPTSVAASDFNGDGKLDLAVVNNTDSTVSILLGRGDGTFVAAVGYSAGFFEFGPSSLAVGDLNGDGKLDLIVTGSGSTTEMLGNGDGTFQAAVGVPPGLGGSFVVLGDFDRDGKLDWVVATSWSAQVYFSSTSYWTPYVVGGQVSCVALGDFNGDGGLDLAVTGAYSDTVSILLGNFSAPGSWASQGWGTFGQEVDQGLPVFGYYAIGPIAADFNGDGKPELAVAYFTSHLILYYGVFIGGVSYDTGSVPSALATGDFNRDGKQDMVAVNAGFMGSGSVGVLLGNGDGTFQAALTSGAGWKSMVVGDFNGDGRLDLAVSDGSSVSLLLGNGDGTFEGAIGAGVAGVPLAAGDFNGDGKLDLVVADQSNNVSLLLGNGDGSFRPPTSTGTSGGLAAVADFNSDGRLDLAVANKSSGIVAVLLGNGDGTFQPPVNYIVSWPTSMAVADYNGDGVPDLAVLSFHTVSLLLGTPDGTLQMIPGLLGGQVGESLIAADFDGDGTADLAATGGRVTFLPTSESAYSIGTFLNRPVIALYPSQLTFSAGADAALGASQSVTVSNPGLLPLKVSGVSATGDFTQTNDCGSPVLSAGVCTITVTSTLTGAGTTTGSLSITDNAPGSPHLISLSGTGPSEPGVSVSPLSLSFASQQVAATSTKQSVTVTSTGSAPLTVTSLAVSGDFAQTNTCGSSVAAGASCTINVTFTPTASGTRTGTITIADDAPGSPQTVSLTGTATGPVAILSAAAMSMGGQMIGTTSAVHTLTLTNSGTTALSITSIATTNGFDQTNNCGASLAAGTSCTIEVTFTPSSAGEIAGTLSATDNAWGSPQQASLSGIGQDFAMGFSPTTETVSAGRAAFYNLQISPLGGFNQTVALSCSGVPQFASCIISPASIAPANGPVGVSMKVMTKAPSQTFASGAAPWRLPPLRPPVGPTKAPWLWLGALATGLVTLAARRRRLVLASALILLSVTMWVACGGGATPLISTPGTPPGTFTLTVNAASGPLAHTATTTLVVQ